MKQKKPHKPDQQKEPDQQAELEELRQQLDALQHEKDEIFRKLQRVSADYANFQKRAPKQVSDAIAYEKEKLIKGLLPALDNFEHTLQNADSIENVDVIAKGIQIIYDQVLNLLKSHGVEQINALGQEFDPALHEAMLQKAESNERDNSVLEEYQKGYRLNGRVIRPSKVIVNKLPSEQPDAQQVESMQESAEQQPDLQGQTTEENRTDEVQPDEGQITNAE
jgi:molecular chaperone GrpE